MEKKRSSEINYLTFGSPIMDLIVDVDQSFIEKFHLKLDTTSHADKEDTIFDELNKRNPIHVAGGCSYNAIRILNWMINDTDLGKVGCLGSIGDDEYGRVYTKLLENEGIEHLFQEFSNDRTGVCATICEGRDRCHRTDLGASIKISEEFVNYNWEKIKNVKLIYTEMYILSHREQILYKLAELCLDDDKLFGFNFPSIGFLDAFETKILDMISYGDVLFANKEEAKHFATNCLRIKFNDDIGSLAVEYAKLPKKNINKSRVFVITCGPEPAHVAVYNHKTQEVEYKGSFIPWQVETEKIIDTNGAGDSFAGGFLSYYVQGKKIKDCVMAGHWAAKEIIQVRGCEIPKNVKVPSEKELQTLIVDEIFNSKNQDSN